MAAKIAFLLFIPILAGVFYHSGVTEIGLEMSWERAKRDPFTKRTVTTRTDFVRNQQMVARFALSMLTLMWFAVLFNVVLGG